MTPIFVSGMPNRIGHLGFCGIQEQMIGRDISAKKNLVQCSCGSSSFFNGVWEAGKWEMTLECPAPSGALGFAAWRVGNDALRIFLDEIPIPSSSGSLETKFHGHERPFQIPAPIGV